MANRIEQLKILLTERPGDCFLRHALALEYIKQNDDETARAYFEENLKIDERYIATYYHLGQLLERTGLSQEALSIYEKGMNFAQQAGDMHAFGELRSVYEELAD